LPANAAADAKQSANAATSANPRARRKPANPIVARGSWAPSPRIASSPPVARWHALRASCRTLPRQPCDQPVEGRHETEPGDEIPNCLRVATANPAPQRIAAMLDLEIDRQLRASHTKSMRRQQPAHIEEPPKPTPETLRKPPPKGCRAAPRAHPPAATPTPRTPTAITARPRHTPHRRPRRPRRSPRAHAPRPASPRTTSDSNSVLDTPPRTSTAGALRTGARALASGRKGVGRGAVSSRVSWIPAG
jgi:hypothetical protein